jgi:hypothetical protein
MFSVSQKQKLCLARGEKILVALPIPTDWDSSDYDSRDLLQWARDSINLPPESMITHAAHRKIWLDCSNPKGGLTEYYGSIIPDVATWSINALRPIPSQVIAVELSPLAQNYPNPTEAHRLVWPLSWISPSGYMFDSVAGNW